MPLKTNNIKRIFNNKKSGNYEIDGKMVKVDVSGDTMVLKYPSDFFELTYILIDISDEIGYTYQQLGMNTKKDMKFVVDLDGLQ